MKSGTNKQGIMLACIYIIYSQTRAVLILKEAFTNCQLSISWL